MALLKVGVIGFGNCGGQIVESAAANGFDTIAINASQRDLNLLDKGIITITIGDGKGTGKDRDLAKEFLESHIEVMDEPAINDIVAANDIIIVCSSAGGGFGSGAAPTFVKKLQEKTNGEKVIIPCGILPVESETYTAQDHSLQFMNELLPLDTSYLIYDNQQFVGTGMTPNDICEAVNDQIIRDFMVIRGDFVTETRSGGIDERDLLTVWSTPGRIVIGVLEDITEDMIQDEGVAAALKTAIAKSAHASLVEDKKIAASALMYELSGNFVRYCENIPNDIQHIFGSHITDYRNEAIIEDGEESSVALAIAGLSLPTGRLEKIIKRHKALETDITTNKSSNVALDKVETGKLKLKSKKSFSNVSKPKVNQNVVNQFNTKNTAK